MLFLIVFLALASFPLFWGIVFGSLVWLDDLWKPKENKPQDVKVNVETSESEKDIFDNLTEVLDRVS